MQCLPLQSPETPEHQDFKLRRKRPDKCEIKSAEQERRHWSHPDLSLACLKWGTKNEAECQSWKRLQICLNLHSLFWRWGNRSLGLRHSCCHMLVKIVSKPPHFHTSILLTPLPFLNIYLHSMCTWLRQLPYLHYGCFCRFDNIWDQTQDSVKMKYQVKDTSKLYMQFTQQYFIKTNPSYWPHRRHLRM